MRQAPSGRTTPETLTAEIERERKKLQYLVAALEAGEPSATIFQAIRTREERIRTLEGERARALVLLRPVASSLTRFVRNSPIWPGC